MHTINAPIGTQEVVREEGSHPHFSDLTQFQAHNTWSPWHGMGSKLHSILVAPPENVFLMPPHFLHQSINPPWCEPPCALATVKYSKT